MSAAMISSFDKNDDFSRFTFISEVMLRLEIPKEKVLFQLYSLLLLLCFDLLIRQKMPFKVVHQKEVTYPSRWKSEEVA